MKSGIDGSKWVAIATIVFFILPASPVLAEETDMILLAGDPESIGRTWGKMNKEAIIQDMKTTYLDPAEEAGLSRETLIERAAVYNRITETIAPHRLQENRAIAREVGLDEDLYLAFCGSVSRKRFLKASESEDKLSPPVTDGDIIECTSYAVPRSRAKDGAILFHKTRDNVDRPQVAVIVENATPGVNKFIAVTDIGSLRGLSMVVNDKGLAIAGDYPASKKKDSSTLVLPDAPPKYRGLMGGDILRYMAEKAASSKEALAILEDFVRKGYYAGGDVNGQHLLFVDKDGVIIEACNNAQHVVSKVHDKEAYFSRFNKEKPVLSLRAADQVDFAMFQNVQRERPILTGQSISGMTVEIDPDHPETLTVAWVSLPARVAAFPLFMGQRRTPKPLVDGAAYALGKRTADYRQEGWKQQRTRWAALEAAMHRERTDLANDVRDSIEAGNPLDADIQRLEDFSRAQATALIEVLRNTN